MARIRTVKPQLFKHEGLFELERETGLPIRLAWIGLFTLADREGRFKWRPRELKADIMPYDENVDFAAILSALASIQLIQRYQVDGEFFGHIPKWHQHQHVNAREAKSTIPAPELATPGEVTSEVQETHVHARALQVHARGEGKGREGKGKEGSVRVTSLRPRPAGAGSSLQRHSLTSVEHLREILGETYLRDLDEALRDPEYIRSNLSKLFLHFRDRPSKNRKTVTGWRRCVTAWMNRGWDRHINSLPGQTGTEGRAFNV